MFFYIISKYCKTVLTDYVNAPVVGLEPTTRGLTVRCSNQLSYTGIFSLKLYIKIK